MTLGLTRTTLGFREVGLRLGKVEGTDARVRESYARFRRIDLGLRMGRKN